MTQALAYGFPASSESGNEPNQPYGLDANFNLGQNSRAQGAVSANNLSPVDREPPSSEPNGEAEVRQNGGLHGEPVYHQDVAAMSRPGNTDYDNFLAITGLGVKMPSQGTDAASRLGLGAEMEALKAQPNQGIPASLQEYLNGISRPTSSGQLLNLHSRLPPPVVSIHKIRPDQALPADSSLEHQQNVNITAVSQLGANGVQNAQPEHVPVPTDVAAKPVDEKREQPLPAPASGIQQLLFSISMPQMNGVSRSSSRNSILNPNGLSPTAAATSLADVLAAVQPQLAPTTLTVPTAAAPEGAASAGADVLQPAGSAEAAAENAAAKSEAQAAALVQPAISAFAAVADSPLDEDASKALLGASAAPAQAEAPAPITQALLPPQVKPNAIGGPQLAQNLFDPPFPTVASSSSLTGEGPPVRPASAQEGLLSRVPNPEHAALLRQLQQFAPEASQEDLLRALHTHILQQAQLQQRASAPVISQPGPPGPGAPGQLPGAPIASHASYPGAAGTAAMLQQAGLLARGGLPQQLNRTMYPGQVSGQMSGQMSGRATPPAGLQLPFQGLAERALAGMETYNNAQPKPQATTQQMRFGGNIGVHAINRTSAAPLSNPTQQQLLQQPGLGALGGQGMGLGALSGINNPLAGLPGAPRPAVRPPNWQRAQALAAQAQAQAQQQAAIKMAAARAEAQRQAQLQAAQQQNRQNFLAGLTPAQVQLLMNAPAHQVNALAAQLGMLDTGARAGNLGAGAPGLAANQALLQQQKLAAARASFAASQQAQRGAAPNPMLGLQQPQQNLLGLQQARQGARNIPGAVNNFGALGVGNNPLNMPGQPAQGGVQATPNAPRTNVVEMGRYLAQNGISVEQAVNSGILGGFSAFDVRALSEGHHQELQRLRNLRAQQAAQAAAVSQQQQQQQHQQLLQQQLLRQNQLQQLQQAQAAQAAQQQAQDAQLSAQAAGSDAGSQGGATPNSTSVMNLGPGSLGQLFDWGTGQARQQGLPGATSQGSNWDPNSMRGLLGSQMGSMLHPQLSGSGTALSGLAASLQGAGMARHPIDAPSDPNLSLHTLRSKSPWEGATGGPLASTQPHSAHSSHATTPRPGTMGSLLEVPASGFGPIGQPAGQPAAPKYGSQGSLDGELTGYVKPNPGAHAPIGRGSRTSQTEVPSSVRAFWETGSTTPGFSAPGNTMTPAFDLEAIDAALERAAGQPEHQAMSETFNIPGSDGQEAFAAPADLNSFDSGNYSFFNQGASLADTAQELHGLSLESEIEDRAGIGNLLDDIGPGDKPAQTSRH